MLPPRPMHVYCVGSQVEDIGQADQEGTSHSIEAGRGRVVVLEFWGTRCPLVQKTEKARRQLVANCGPRGVAYFAIESNRDESPEEIKEYLRERGSSYTVLIDYGNDIARRFNATRTPAVCVLDREGVVRYIGPPFSPEQLDKPEPDRADWLEPALEAVLAGRDPTPAARPIHGTLIRKFMMPD